MNCDQIKEWIAKKEFFESSICDAVKKHIDKCSVCKKLYNLDIYLEKQIKEGLQKVDPPADFLNKLQLALAEKWA